MPFLVKLIINIPKPTAGDLFIAGAMSKMPLATSDLKLSVANSQYMVITKLRCRIPDDHLSKRIWKLTLARKGLGKLLESLKAQAK
ncbi:hypothetical protein B0T39_05540 [Chromobacterium haemolyticum]|nr:hypothetical protein B0T39_05540 [Chromobacterium haemolyticum]